jgi:hypothetical protein
MGDFSGPLSDHSGIARCGRREARDRASPKVDIKTVRRHFRKIDAGAAALSNSAKPASQVGNSFAGF